MRLKKAVSTHTETSAQLRRIFFVISTLEIGGAEQHLVAIAKELKARNWTPEIFVLSPNGALLPQLVESRIPVHEITAPNWVHAIPVSLISNGLKWAITVTLLTKHWRATRPVAVHFFLPAAYLIGGFAAIFAGVRPRIMSRRSLNNYQTAHPFLAQIEKWLHRRMNLACGNSIAVTSQLAQEGFEPERIRLIYNGIQSNRYACVEDRGNLRRQNQIEDAAFIIVIVANLIPYKGHADLLHALSHIRLELPSPWQLICIGRDDGIGDHLSKTSHSLGIGDNVRWLGPRSDVPRWLCMADVGVLCSHQEGFSNAVLECMAAGLPLVVTDVGGNAEAVVDGDTGYVVPARQPQALGKAVLRLALSPDRRSMGARGGTRANALFSLSACVDAYEALYREVATEQL